ncbi:MAG: L-aspartate oxidase [archaeon]|nr:L-aspartate oxidase [archaeon]
MPVRMGATAMSRVSIIGSGIAGLFAALRLADAGHVVTIITKKRAKDSSTNWAQGGIAAILDKTNSDGLDSHINDTLLAGDGYCDFSIVEMVVKEAHLRIQDLIDLGVDFQRNSDGEFSTAREGGHREHRILHAKDATGREIESALIRKSEAHPNINILSNTLAIDLIRRNYSVPEQGVAGVWCYNQITKEIHTIPSDVVILATGGVGVLWEKTTNPDVATGDGIAMAHRFGAEIKDMAFVQFHPTASILKEGRPFLVTEALRGHGAVILDAEGMSQWTEMCKNDGENNANPEKFSFTNEFTSMGSLATRDVLARAIDTVLKRTGDACVFLVTSHLDTVQLNDSFPTVSKHLREFGLQLGIDPIPVAPAAHYMVGGIKVNRHGQAFLNKTERVIPSLYAIGEVACTGMHGANRLASNSLLEAVVFAHNAASHIILKSHETFTQPLPDWRADGLQQLKEHAPLRNDLRSLQHLMLNEVGIVRSNQRLYRARRRVELLEKEISLIWESSTPTRELIELRNLVQVGSLVVEDALQQSSNRGLHFNIDLKDDKNEP